jgi:hypothetical protein
MTNRNKGMSKEEIAKKLYESEDEDLAMDTFCDGKI